MDVMAGCGLRSLRYGLEAAARCLEVNDADPDRLPLLRRNLFELQQRCVIRLTAQSGHRLLAAALLRGARFDLVDLDAFGSPHALLPLALEVVALDGVLYLGSSDGRGSTGHDRRAGLRHLGASVRCHPSSWELALRLQLGVIARMAWQQGRGVEPVFSFSDGRTFRTAVRLRKRPGLAEEKNLGLLAICHHCGDQQVQPLLQLGRWAWCGCQAKSLAVSGPLWIGALQHTPTLDAMAEESAGAPGSLSPQGARLLARLQQDEGCPARCWPNALIARYLGSPQPPLPSLVERLRARGHRATTSAVMPGQLRSDAPWRTILSVASDLVGGVVK